MARSAVLLGILTLLVNTRVGFSQQSNELAVTTAETTIATISGETEILMAGSMVAVDSVLDDNRGLLVAAERVYLTNDASKNEELIVGVIPVSHALSPAKAISFFNEHLLSDGSDVSSLLGRGNAYVCIRDVTKALEDFDRAIERHPDNPVLLLRRAETLRRIKRYEAAAADCQKSIGLAPRMVPALLTRARSEETWVKSSQESKTAKRRSRSTQLPSEHIGAKAVSTSCKEIWLQRQRTTRNTFSCPRST